MDVYGDSDPDTPTPESIPTYVALPPLPLRLFKVVCSGSQCSWLWIYLYQTWAWRQRRSHPPVPVIVVWPGNPIPVKWLAQVTISSLVRDTRWIMADMLVPATPLPSTPDIHSLPPSPTSLLGGWRYDRCNTGDCEWWVTGTASRITVMNGNWGSLEPLVTGVHSLLPCGVWGVRGAERVPVSNRRTLIMI